MARLRDLKPGDNIALAIESAAFDVVDGSYETNQSGHIIAPAAPVKNSTVASTTAAPDSQSNLLVSDTSPLARLTPQAPWPLKRAEWVFSSLWAEFTKLQLENKNWKPNEAKSAQATLNLVVGVLGDRVLSDYDSDDMQMLRKAFRELPAKYCQAKPWRSLYETGGPRAVLAAAEGTCVVRTHDKTWNKHYSRISPFMDFARSQQGKALPPGAPNPLQGLFLKLDKDKRAPAQMRNEWRLYNVDELVTMLTAPKFLGSKSASHWKDAGELVIRDHRYWLTLIAFLHGNRREEPTILKVKHVRLCEETGIWYFNWADPALLPLLKDVGSSRNAPLHWKLLDIGFIEARVANRDPNDDLFPDADSDGEITRRAGPFGQWFHEFRLHCGIDGHDVDFHASRHTVLMQLLKKYTSHLIEAVCGHESKERRSALSSYTHPELLLALKPVVDSIDMPIDVDLFNAAVERSDRIDRTAAWPDLGARRKWARGPK